MMRRPDLDAFNVLAVYAAGVAWVWMLLYWILVVVAAHRLLVGP